MPRPKASPKPKILAEDKTEEIIKVDKPQPEKELPDKPKKFISNNFRLWHPFQSKYISETPVELTMDGWLDSQIKAGLVKEI